MENKYLPLWANTYSDFKSQYDACSIMINSDSVNTLLPVRLDEEVAPYLSLRSRFCFTVNKFYGDSGFWRHRNYIQHAKFAFAKKLYNESVMQLMTEYPNIVEIRFGARKDTGIYPIKWKYPPRMLRARLYAIMERKLDDGFYIDEFIRVEFEEKNGIHEYKFYGILEMEKTELEDLLYTNPVDKIKKHPLKKCIRYTLKECKEFFREFSDDILELGNQPRAYAEYYEDNEELFEAARSGELDTVIRLAQMGADLNAMDEEGNTPFALFTEFLLNGENFSELDTEPLEKLIELGANPAMYGIGVNARSALAIAARNGNLAAVKYLLSKGVNPLYYPSKDEEDMSEYTSAGEAEAEYFSESSYRGLNVGAKYINYLEISKLLR